MKMNNFHIEISQPRDEEPGDTPQIRYGEEKIFMFGPSIEQRRKELERRHKELEELIKHFKRQYKLNCNEIYHI